MRLGWKKSATDKIKIYHEYANDDEKCGDGNNNIINITSPPTAT